MTKTHRSRLSFVAGALLALPLMAQAHMTWLLPNATLVTNRDGTVSIDAAVSEDLFIFERSLQLDELRITGPDGTKLQPENRSRASQHESFDVKLSKPGSYRISNVGVSLMGAYKLEGQSKRFRTTQDKLDAELPAGAELTSLSRTSNRQQTFVSREEPGDTKFAPEGDGLEFLPLTSVTDLSNGDSSRLRLLLDGKPVGDAAITVRRAGNRYRYKAGEVTLRTDAQGEVTIPWQEPGAYWVGASVGERGGPGAAGGTRDKPIERASVSATFEVLPK